MMMILKVLKVLTKTVSDYYGVDDDADNDDYSVEGVGERSQRLGSREVPF